MSGPPCELPVAEGLPVAGNLAERGLFLSESKEGTRIGCRKALDGPMTDGQIKIEFHEANLAGKSVKDAWQRRFNRSALSLDGAKGSVATWCVSRESRTEGGQALILDSRWDKCRGLTRKKVKIVPDMLQLKTGI
jgi:hypothetical protein